MKQSLIKTEVNDAGEIKITYISLDWFESTKEPEVQELVISENDLGDMLKALNDHATGKAD